MVTKPVTIKALIRVWGDLAAASDAVSEEERISRCQERLQPWSEQVREFRDEGFYERFPANGQVERVARIHRGLARAIGVNLRANARAAARQAF